MKIIQARLAQALSAVEMTGNALPSDIQWMPPGTHSITPFVAGEPREMTITVNQALAEEFNAQLQQLRADAAAGRGDVPYLDLNHDDAEASAEVTELFWGGDDAKTGGIRARVQWSSAGRDALLGKTFRRFSPQWATNQDTMEPIGIGTNLGGLVNRAAFREIAPVMAKAANAQGIGSRYGNVMAKVDDLMDRKNIPYEDALRMAMARDPGFYQDYMRSMGNKFEPAGSPRKYAVGTNAKAQSDEVMAAARQLAEESNIDLATAIIRIAHMNPQVMAQYRTNILKRR
ncbi:MAG: hypothetical protein JWQ71_3737 [Pedosphaera sp.]|nr:hypothetical protein [Pedosphaera sp.]